MKRYWKSLFLCFLSIIVISTFYIQSSLAGQENIKIELEKLKGSEQEVESLLLYGDYAIGNMYQGLQITSEETINLNQQSFLQRLSSDRVAPIFRELIKHHDNFMRSKDLTSNSFYEDQNLLAYANIKGDFNEYPASEVTFDIEVFNKKSEKTISIESNVPKTEKYSWMYVEDVQAINDSLKVLIRRTEKNGEVYDLRVYTFNLKEQTLTGEDTIVSSQTSEDSWTEIVMNHDYNSIQPQNNYLIIKKTFEAQGVQRNSQIMSYEGEPNLVANEVYIYDLKSGQLNKLTVPDEILKSISSGTIIHSNLFVYTSTATDIEIHSYDIEKAEWGNKRTFALSPSKDSVDEPFIKLMNGKIYSIYSTNNGHILLIGDLKTGETLYEGKLIVLNQKENQKDYRLYFNEIELLSNK